jgi:hypothetical protein
LYPSVYVPQSIKSLREHSVNDGGFMFSAQKIFIGKAIRADHIRRLVCGESPPMRGPSAALPTFGGSFWN